MANADLDVIAKAGITSPSSDVRNVAYVAAAAYDCEVATDSGVILATVLDNLNRFGAPHLGPIVDDTQRSLATGYFQEAIAYAQYKAPEQDKLAALERSKVQTYSDNTAVLTVDQRKTLERDNAAVEAGRLSKIAGYGYAAGYVGTVVEQKGEDAVDAVKNAAKKAADLIPSTTTIVVILALGVAGIFMLKVL